MSRCNYCILQSMRQRAAGRGVEVIVEREPLHDMIRHGSSHAWWLARYSDQEKPSAQFMVLTDGCVC